MVCQLRWRDAHRPLLSVTAGSGPRRPTARLCMVRRRQSLVCVAGRDVSRPWPALGPGARRVAARPTPSPAVRSSTANSSRAVPVRTTALSRSSKSEWVTALRCATAAGAQQTAPPHVTNGAACGGLGSGPAGPPGQDGEDGGNGADGAPGEPGAEDPMVPAGPAAAAHAGRGGPAVARSDCASVSTETRRRSPPRLPVRTRPAAPGRLRVERPGPLCRAVGQLAFCSRISWTLAVRVPSCCS
jgi:hypothetical protein